MKRILSFLFLALALTACADLSSDNGSSSSAPTWEEAASNKLIQTSYQAADQLIEQALPKLENGRPLIVATIVNINALEESSPLGRMIAEQISGQFSRKGLSMIEMKVRNNVYVKQNVGELLLTREIKEIAQNHNAQAVVVGTYTESSQLVFINLKIIRPTDNVVLAAYDYAIPLDKVVRSLLRR
ncbi:MAG: FlgO family outer membrane protein [Burkholderiaceae bacterium]|nr:FlgO family outer membrane protein [Burkholderiaceae bacterium]